MKAAMLRLAAPRILEDYFPLNDGILAPLKAAFLEAVGVDVGEAIPLSNVLAAQYQEAITRTKEHRYRLDRARVAYTRLARGLEQQRSSPLPSGWTYRNAAECAACFARAIVEAQPGVQRSRTQFARIIGRSERNVDAVLARADVVQQPQTVERPIASVQEFTAIERAYDSTQAGYPVAILSIRRDSQVVAARRFDPHEQTFVAQELARGATVAIRYQQANRQVVAETPLPDEPKLVRQRVRPTEKKSVPARPRFFGAGYDPVWVMQWLITLLEQVTTWRQRGGQLVNQETGELLPRTATFVISVLLSPTASLSQTEREHLPHQVARSDWLTEVLLPGGQLVGIIPDAKVAGKEKKYTPEEYAD